MQTISPALLTFLFNSLWQISVITAAAWLASILLRNNPASHRHAIWVLALVASLALPLTSVRTSATDDGAKHFVPSLPQDAAVQSAAPVKASIMHQTVSSAGSRVELAPMVAATAIALYLLFVFFRIARLIVQAIRTAQIRKSSESIEPTGALLDVWARAAQILHVDGAELRVSDSLFGPVTAGKTIILPRNLFESDSETILMAAIGHEMAHIARRDYLLKVVCEILWLPIAFQPFSWLIRRSIERTREIATDELVAHKLLDSQEYAESIFTIAAGTIKTTHPSLSLGVFDGDILEERIRLLTRGGRTRLRHGLLRFVTAVCGLFLCMAAISGFSVPARAQSPALSELKQGVDSYNDGYFSFAVDHFQKAVNLDPNNVNAHLFLATALFKTTCGTPNLPIPSDACTPVVEQYRHVLNLDSLNETAIFGIATLTGTKEPKQAHDLLMRLLNANPANRDALYSVAVIDWREAWMAVQAAMKQANVPQSAMRVPDPAVRAQLRASYEPTIDEGQKFLQSALKIDPQYSNAFAYANLLYRLQGAIADSDADSKNLMESADAMVGKALEARRAQKGTEVSPSSTRLSVGKAPDAVALGPIQLRAPLPPPPPPPPPKAN